MDANKKTRRNYKVVVNHEEQYSILARRPRERPWLARRRQDGRQIECLAFIKSVWTDMRPLSLRKKMAEAGAQDGPRDRPAT